MQIKIPTECPCCSYPLVTVNDQLFCRNTACDAQIAKKLEHFVKTLGIKGLGPKTLEKLELSDLPELFYLDVDTVAEKLSSLKLAEKLVAEIHAAKLASLATVLASFSIPLIGATAATKLAAVISSIDDISEDTCKKAGLGQKATENLLAWYNTEFMEIREFLPFSFSSEKNIRDTSTSKESICITGKLLSFSTKAEAARLLEQAGFIVTESVTKTTNYLVDEAGKSSAKRKKAEEYGITIINNLDKFLRERNNGRKQEEMD
jgi:DNA ligase (NAD+)